MAIDQEQKEKELLPNLTSMCTVFKLLSIPFY